MKDEQEKLEKEETDNRFSLTDDKDIRVFFSVTPFGDELIKAVLEDVKDFEGKAEPQKVFGKLGNHYVVFDYFRKTSKYYIDLEMQRSRDPDIEERASRYLNWITNSILKDYGNFERRGVVIVFFDYWKFDKNLLLKKVLHAEDAQTVNGQIYYVNMHYHGKEIDSYLYRICRDLQRAERGEFYSLETDIIRTVVEYYQQKGGREQAMEQYRKDSEILVDKGVEIGTARGRTEGISEGRNQILFNMCANPKFTDADIADAGNIPVSEVTALRKRLSGAK
ncbi:MAG: hypothetical protein PUA93_00700 [Eubacteriales bacterium]|nr:hypothetical protein [Eubacteriales bacterium]